MRRGSTAAFSPLPIPRQRTSRNRGGFGTRFTGRSGSGFHGPGALPRLRVVGDAGEPPAQLDRSRELATLLIDGADLSGFCLGDDEHR